MGCQPVVLLDQAMHTQSFRARAKAAFAIGSSLGQKLRLFYYLALKPSLACRGLATFVPERILTFSIHGFQGRPVNANVRDNGVGVITIAEFFSPQSAIIPADLPPLQPKVIYDLGANVGIASLLFGSRSPGATVYGFEPLPENLEVCALNFRNLPKPSQVFPWAVGAASGTAVFDCLNDSRGGRLESSPHDPNLKSTGKLEVQVYSISDLVTQKGLLPPDFLKIDVEGAELDVLKGLEQQHQMVKWIYIETHGDDLKRGCQQWLAARGFKVWPGADDTALWGCRPAPN